MEGEEEVADKQWNLFPHCLIIGMKEKKRSRSKSEYVGDFNDDVKPNNGTQLFDAFIERNCDCYWNPHLDESLKNVKYIGCMRSYTLLISGRDIYLETIRSAWSRRVLRAPKGFSLCRVAELQPTPVSIVSQSQFTPLPEALCIIVSDLRRLNKRADLESICLKLKDTYKSIQAPPEQVVYETLDSLLKENKLIYIGNGYELVTPETLAKLKQQQTLHNRLSVRDHNLIIDGDSETPTLYIPIMQPNQPDSRSISCQTSPVEEEGTNKMNNTDEYDLSPKKIERSYSLRYKRDHPKTLRRTSSLLNQDKKRSKNPLQHSATMPLVSETEKNLEHKRKRSLIKKLFSWKRKSDERKQDNYHLEGTSDKEVEYATFSAQFPPPEWELQQLQRFFVQNGNTCPVHHRKSKTLPLATREENVYEDVIVQENQNQGMFTTDISIKYNGKFLKKNNPLSRSRENGVNCMEFDKDAERRASLRKQKRKEEKLKREDSFEQDPLYYQCSNSSGYHSQQTSFSVQSPDAKKETVKEIDDREKYREENVNRMTSSSSWSSYSSISKQTVKENPDYLEKQHRLANERLKRDARNRFSNDFQVVGVV